MTAIQAWATAGLVEVPLPSGFRVKLVPVTPATLVLLDLAPTIVDEVLDAQAAGATADEAAARIGQTALGVALRAVRAVCAPGSEEWEPVTLTAADVVAGAFPPDDLEAVMEAALGRLESKEGPVSYDDLRGFRDGAEGTDGGEDGGAVRAAPVLPRRDRRSAARAGARRGAGAPPVDR